MNGLLWNSEYLFLAVQGWRGVFFVLAGVFAGVSLLVPLLGVEPRSLARAPLKPPVVTGQSMWLGQQIGEMTACLGTVFRIRTFLAILAVNSIWVVCNGGVGFMVVYFQVGQNIAVAHTVPSLEMQCCIAMS